jgi:purine-binding chemotaxis protein CheW
VVQSDGRSVGLVVDSAREFLAIAPEAIQPPGQALTGTTGRYIEGIANISDRLILVLDLQQVLNLNESISAA